MALAPFGRPTLRFSALGGRPILAFVGLPTTSDSEALGRGASKSVEGVLSLSAGKEMMLLL